MTSTASVASGTQTNFPMLVSSTLASWKTTSTDSVNGKIQNLCTAPNGGDEPCDLVFSASASCTSPLNHETESYTSSTGALIDWVNVPSLSAGTVIYACYGGASVITDQSRPSSTWNGNYKSVWHFANPTSTLQGNDSTANKNNLTNNNGTATSSLIDGGLGLNGTTAYMSEATNTGLAITGDFTFSCWVKATAQQAFPCIAKTNGTSVWDYEFIWSIINGWNLDFYADAASYDFRTVETYNSNWNYLVASRSGNTLTIYLNGIAVNSTSSYSYTLTNNVSSVYVGYDDSFGKGIQDDSRISNAVRSSQWILTEYNNQNSPSTFYAVGNQTVPAVNNFSIRFR